MSENIKVENNAAVENQTIINIKTMSGNIALPGQTITYTLPEKDTKTLTGTEVVLSTDYYNLFVIGAESFQNDYFWIEVARSVKANEYTDVEIADKFGILDKEAISQIVTFPTLFMSEFSYAHGRICPGQFAYFGVVTEIRKQKKECRIYFQKYASVPMESIVALSRELDIGVDFGGRGEITRTHWSIKNADLISELMNSGINVIDSLNIR